MKIKNPSSFLLIIIPSLMFLGFIFFNYISMIGSSILMPFFSRNQGGNRLPPPIEGNQGFEPPVNPPPNQFPTDHVIGGEFNLDSNLFTVLPVLVIAAVLVFGLFSLYCKLERKRNVNILKSGK